MIEAHLAIGGLVVALNALVAVVGLFAYWRELDVPALLGQGIALTQTLALLQGAFGLYLLAGNHRAPTQLHYVYGLLPSAAVAFAYSARTESARHNLLVFSLCATVIAGLAARAYTTGMA